MQSLKSPQASFILTALVKNKTGVLNRVASLFRRRRFNIESLTVGHSEKEGLSRMTIAVDSTTNIQQVIGQMEKLIEVKEIKLLGNTEEVIVRDLALVQLEHTAQTVKAITKLKRKFAYKLAAQHKKNLILEFTGTPTELTAFFEALKDLPVKKITKTGITAI